MVVWQDRDRPNPKRRGAAVFYNGRMELDQRIQRWRETGFDHETGVNPLRNALNPATRYQHASGYSDDCALCRHERYLTEKEERGRGLEL